MLCLLYKFHKNSTAATVCRSIRQVYGEEAIELTAPVIDSFGNSEKRQKLSRSFNVWTSFIYCKKGSRPSHKKHTKPNHTKINPTFQHSSEKQSKRFLAKMLVYVRKWNDGFLIHTHTHLDYIYFVFVHFSLLQKMGRKFAFTQ